MDNFGGNLSTISGFLVDAVVESQHISLLNNQFTVPSGKRLYLLNIDNCSPIINGKNKGNTIQGGELIISNAGDIITGTCSNAWYFNGYLADENYFADCGGGGGSSSSTVDSSYIDSLVQFYSSGNGGGCDFSFPDGLDGDFFSWSLDGNDFTVPTGKNLYITNVFDILMCTYC